MNITEGVYPVAPLLDCAERLFGTEAQRRFDVLTASSFCGANGAVWGYHLAVADEIAGGTLKPHLLRKRTRRPPDS
jgi:hypothetical protein